MPDNAQSAEQTPEGSSQPNTQSTVPPGVQERINELVGRDHEKNRQLDSLNETVQQLIAQNAALAAKQSMVAPIQPTIPEGVDTNTVSFMQAQFTQMLNQQAAMFKQELGQALGGVRQSQEMTEFQQATNGVDPKVAADAKKLLGDWKNAGLTGWTPQDAVIYAEGQAARRARSQQVIGRPNGSGDMTPGGSLPPATDSRTSLPAAKSDEELRRMSPQQQEAYWAARVGDSELVY